MNSPLTILVGDCRTLLRELPDESVQCCVTSPPYWGLRDYGTATWEGGDPVCDHKPPPSTKGDYPDSNRKQQTNSGSFGYREWRECAKCGARRIDSQIGLEPTPEAYVETMVAVFREVRRVLKPDGTLWLNLGDSYATSPPGNRGNGQFNKSGLHGAQTSETYKRTLESGTGQKRNTIVGNLKPKDLVGIPWRVAFALQADGWWLRSEIVWNKPNPMPESVTDRPTKAHEYIFLLTKSERYYYDAEAIAEPVSKDMAWRSERGYTRGGNGKVDPSRNDISTLRGEHSKAINGGTRNKRSVWTVPTMSYPESHFATFPPDLIKPCILAGCPVGGTVLDPFGGSGTTGQVAIEFGRKAILIELNPEYAKLIDKRTTTTMGLAL